MKSLLIVVAAVLLSSPAAFGYWSRTDVTRSLASKEHLPLKITVTPVPDGKTPSVYEVTYEVILTGPFAHLQSANVIAFDGKTLLFSVPVATPVHFVHPEDEPERNGPETIKGKFLVGQELLRKCRMNLECPVGPWNSSGQTISVDLGSYLK